jgi:hypothetical protein
MNRKAAKGAEGAFFGILAKSGAYLISLFSPAFWEAG